MHRKKKTPDDLLAKHKAEFEAAYTEALDDATGQLYNKFVAYISEARIPLNNVLMVLEILKAEAVEQMRKKQELI
jgi:hypothetical protein